MISLTDARCPSRRRPVRRPADLGSRHASAVLMLVALLATAPGSALAAAQAQEPDGEIEAQLLRTWQPEDVTVVDGLANVPLAILGGGTAGAYRFELTVFDAEGNQLYRDGWERTLSERAATYVQAGSSLREPFRFGLRPGSYDVELRAFPTDAPSLGAKVRLSLDGYEGRPPASDLFLASRIEPLAEGAGGGDWSITHGGYGISAAAETTVLPQEPRIYYYLELYGPGDGPREATVAAEVEGSGGRVLYRTPETQVEVTPGGVPFTGQLPLAGLPAGEYELVMRVSGLDGEELVRRATFRMLDREQLAGGAEAESFESEYFASLSEEELEDEFGGVAYMVTEAERRTYENLPPDAKRRYLTEFFQSRDPDPLAPGNPFLDEYLDRVGTIRSRYAANLGTGSRKPWQTAQGRIYLKFGPPSDQVVNHFPADESSTGSVARGSRAFGGEPPYEIWYYGESTGFVYLFVAEDRFDNWRLIYTTDPDERTLPDWTERLGPSALRDLRDNFGITPRFGPTGIGN